MNVAWVPPKENCVKINVHHFSSEGPLPNGNSDGVGVLMNADGRRLWGACILKHHTTKSLMNAISKYSVKEPVILEIPNGFDVISCVVQFAQHFMISITLLTSQGHIFLGLTVVLMLLLDTLLVVSMWSICRCCR